MKYFYAYKSSDGIRHEASIEAPSRDEAFAMLRKEGIRPIKVCAQDGSKENGAPKAFRWRAAAVLAIVAGGVLWGLVSVYSVDTFETDETRRYPIGDAAIIEKGILTGWSDVFADEGERFLASFAVPGVKAGQRNTTVGEIEEALGRKIAPDANDSLEARQIKAMVEGMKREAREYVRAGGNIVEYGKRLTERQDAEIAIYERTKTDMERAKATLGGIELIDFWEEENDKLRSLGIRPVTLESLE